MTEVTPRREGYLLDTQSNRAKAYLVLESDRDWVTREICKGNENIAESVLGAIAVEISDPEKNFSHETFCTSKNFRAAIYRKRVIDCLRRTDVLEQRQGSGEDAYLQNMLIPSEGSASLEESIPNAKDVISEYVEEILEEAQLALAEGKIRQTVFDRIAPIIEGGLAQKTMKEIGEELGVQESRISQIIKELRQVFLKYEDFWSVLFPKEIEKSKKALLLKELEISTERIQSVMMNLSNRDNLTNWEKAILLCTRYYLDPNFKQKVFEVQLEQIGIASHSQNLSRLRREVEQLAGDVPINWLLFRKKS